MITIIDYGMGNLGSLLNMIRHVGGEAKITSSIDEISEAKKIILPGVGRMDTGMKILKNTKIDQAIYLAKKISILKYLEFVWVCIFYLIQVKKVIVKVWGLFLAK